MSGVDPTGYIYEELDEVISGKTFEKLEKDESGNLYVTADGETYKLTSVLNGEKNFSISFDGNGGGTAQVGKTTGTVSLHKGNSSTSGNESVDLAGSGGDENPGVANSKSAEKFLLEDGERAGELFCQSDCSANENLAHIGAANRYLGASIAANREASWRVYELDDGTFSFTYANIGSKGSAYVRLPTPNESLNLASAGHTHWDSNGNFSPQDWRLITQEKNRGFGIKLYLASRDGKLQYSTPKMARKHGISRGAGYFPPYKNFSGKDVSGSNLSTSWK